nr:putative glucan endo-1,3-beta-glucosidase GVI [Tanacetum cinerariifolium]
GGVAGVNYGLIEDNLPSPAEAINLIKSKTINRIRIFSPNHDVLNAVQNSGIQVIIGTFNDDVPRLASDANFAINWVETNIVPYAQSIKFRCISVGNEIIPGNLASSVLPAMGNLNSALQSFSLSNIPVSTAIGFSALASSYPPSSGDFKDTAMMGEITGYLCSHETFVRDGDLEYKNMFDAMVDSVNWAAEKVGAGGLDIVVAESGWPSNGNGEYTTPSLAQTYNQNLVRHAGSGTPKNPSKSVETYVFALFNENQKTPGVEQNFGLFYPDMSEVYHINF